MLETNVIYNEDCIEGMKKLPDNSVDLILTDPPYRTTSRGHGGNSGGMAQKDIFNRGDVFENNEVKILALHENDVFSSGDTVLDLAFAIGVKM